MDRHRFTTEDRNEHLTDETRAQFTTLTRDIIRGEAAATESIVEALQGYIADDNTAAALVRATLLNSQALLPVLTELIWAEAAELAEVEVQKKERNRAESEDEARIEHATWARVA